MAEKSFPWTANGTGDGTSGGATALEWGEIWRRMFNGGREANGGVAKSHGNELAVSGSASPVAVATGAAWVYGKHYANDASLNLTITTPVVGTTGGHIILRVDWVAQTVRAVAVRNTDGVNSTPALVQSTSTQWEIRLASITITTGGVVALTDTREYARSSVQLATANIQANAADNTIIRDSAALSVIGRSANSTGDPADIAAGSDGHVLRQSGTTLGFGQVVAAGIAVDTVDDTIVGNRVPALTRRAGGSATDWSTYGTTTYTPTSVRMQAGAVLSNGSGVSTVTFPVAFSQPPLVFLQGADPVAYGSVTVVSAISTTQFSFFARDNYSTGIRQLPINWLAIGSE